MGSGGGFIKEFSPEIVTSDIIYHKGIDRKINANKLPFPDKTLRAIVGINVLHHIPKIEKFFYEAVRTLNPHGRVIFIEPWPTALSVPIYQYLHHEPFDRTRDWYVRPGDPLFSANGALPWIIFSRDRNKFLQKFPALHVASITTFMPFSYLISGGIERRWPLFPWLFSWVRNLEKPFDFLGLFALIVVEKD